MCIIKMRKVCIEMMKGFVRMSVNMHPMSFDTCFTLLAVRARAHCYSWLFGLGGRGKPDACVDV